MSGWRRKKVDIHGTSIQVLGLAEKGTCNGVNIPPEYYSIHERISPEGGTILGIHQMIQSTDTDPSYYTTMYPPTNTLLRRIKASGEFC